MLENENIKKYSVIEYKIMNLPQFSSKKIGFQKKYFEKLNLKKSIIRK